MAFLKDWAFSVCCAVIICGIFNIMLPEGSFGKIFKVVLSVFFICVIISPLLKIDLSYFKNDFKLNEKEYDFEDNVFSENSLEYIENEIYSSVKEILEKSGITAKDIILEINIFEDFSIDINKFVIKISKEDYTDSLEDKIYKDLGIMPEIVFSEDLLKWKL